VWQSALRLRIAYLEKYHNTFAQNFNPKTCAAWAVPKNCQNKAKLPIRKLVNGVEQPVP
jgi:hypothetical protein